MNRYLLDVNVLLALVLPSHASHAAAHNWFAKSGHTAWATNVVIQLGLLRLLTNSAVSQGTVSAAGALEILRELIGHPNHELWPMNRDASAALSTIGTRVRGHRQWTDAMLLTEAAHRKGVLVTFDSGLQQLARAELSDHLLILKNRS
jgi:hypothetical protein